MTATVYRQQKAAIGNANGIAWVSTDGKAGAVSGGGFAEMANGGGAACSGVSYSGSDTTSTDDAQDRFPLIATFCEFDSGSGKTYFALGFKCPPGVYIATHLWELVP